MMIMTREDKIIQKFIEKFPWEKLTKDVTDKYYKDYTNRYLHEVALYSNDSISIRLFENIEYSKDVVPFSRLADFLKKKYNLAKWQLTPLKYNGIDSMDCSFSGFGTLVALIPDYENDIKVMDSEFAKMGYFNAKTYKHNDNNGLSWCVVTYNPIKKYNCNDLVRSRMGVLYHITPIELYDKIKNEGIKSYNSNMAYNNEKRSFFFKDNWSDDKSIEMMKFLVDNVWKKRGYSGKAIILCIEAKNVPDSVNFYLDPNAEGCVCCNDIIKPEWISFQYSMEYWFK